VELAAARKLMYPWRHYVVGNGSMVYDLDIVHLYTQPAQVVLMLKDATSPLSHLSSTRRALKHSASHPARAARSRRRETSGRTRTIPSTPQRNWNCCVGKRLLSQRKRIDS